MENLAVPAITLKPLLTKNRTVANRRERERVQSLRTAFKALGEVVPRDDAEPQLTRIDVVRRATNYIAYLAGLLESNSDVKSPACSEGDDGDSISCTSGDSDDFRATFLDWRAECKELMRLPEKRVKCNERARTRSRQTKEAFSKLKDLVPIHPAEAELSRIEVLRRASEYIASMFTLLGETDKADCNLRPVASEVSSNSDSVNIDCLSELLCSPDNAASFSSSTASPANSLTLDLANVGITALPQSDLDSDYASMSPPSSAASDCSFTFPSTSHPVDTALSTSPIDTSCHTTTVSTGITRHHSSLARSASHPYAPCSPRPRHFSNGTAHATNTCFRPQLRRQRRSFSDSDLADIDLDGFLVNEQTNYNVHANWPTFSDHLSSVA